MKQPLRLTVNGQTYEVIGDTRLTLLDLLRDVLYLTGTKEGCGNGNCGACTVIMHGRNVLSCLVLACEVADQEVLTVEGWPSRAHRIRSRRRSSSMVGCSVASALGVLDVRESSFRSESPSHGARDPSQYRRKSLPLYGVR